jgi:hypothetical protein
MNPFYYGQIVKQEQDPAFDITNCDLKSKRWLAISRNQKAHKANEPGRKQVEGLNNMIERITHGN